MGKNSVGRYILIFEPKYAYHQFAVRFDADNSIEVTKIKKYSDEYYGNSKKTVKKNLLGDIDMITTSMTCEEFFKKYIDPSIFNYNMEGIHKMFIGYKDAGRMKSLKVEFNNPKLYEKSQLIEGSKIKDGEAISYMVDLLTDPDSKFLRYVYDRQTELKEKYFSSVSDAVIQNARDLRRCRKLMNIGGEAGLMSDYMYLESQLKEKLSSYKEFRALYLFKNKYIYALKEEKEKLEHAKEKVETISKKTDTPWALCSKEELPPMGEQLTLFDITYPDKGKVKKLK